MGYSMKVLAAIGVMGLVIGCTFSVPDAQQQEGTDGYRPGFGEFMSTVQVHHEKLWFAGTNANWPLADFEVHEIEETLADLKQYQPDRKESALLGMMDHAMDSLDAAIEKQDTAMFRAGYTLLTNTCNSCHVATEHGFIVIKVPDTPPFSNQVFQPRK